MTPEFPALRESLVRAAARRRRRRLTVRFAVPAFAVATAGVFLLLPGGPTEPEREVATPAPQRSVLEQSFAVFRRPHDDGDRLPQGASVPGAVQLGDARRLAHNGPDSFFAVPSSVSGKPSL